MRKALTIIAVVVVVLAIAAGVATITYTHSDDYTGNVLPEGVTVNGVNCSGLTYDEAKDELTGAWNKKHLQVVGKLGETLADYTNFDCTYDIDRQLANIKRDNLITAGINHYLHTPFSVSIAMNVKNCGGDFAEEVKDSAFLHRDGLTETQDAYVDLDDPDFAIVPEVYGTKADANSYLADITKAIALGQFRFEFDETAYLSIPKVKSDDPELLKYQKYAKEYLRQKISYKLGDDSFTLSARDLDSLMKDDMSGDADESKVAEYVHKFKKKYDVTELTFNSLTGKSFNVAVGNHGWIIDEAAETKKLTENINSHEDVDRSPEFSQKGVGSYSKTLDVGNTYIDVDITKQHVCYFESGKLAWDADCVTGCWAAGHDTPTGVYDVKSKGRNITLKSGGKKKDPGYYESFVSYWMPFLGNSYGLHDANWRTNFGGDIYKYSGSHGCVNLPPKKAAELYNMISVGTIVIIHK